MTEAKITKFRSNLARKMSAPGGRSIAEAVQKAERGLDQHRVEGMKTIAAHLGELEALVEAKAPGSEPKVYERAAAIVDMAGFFDTGPFYAAAFSLCELADRMNHAGAWSWPSAQVHVRAMRRILADGCRESEEAAQILSGLKAVLERHTPA